METKRLTIPAAEEILGGYFPVLDHGFVALVDYMGSDEAVEQAARVSYGAGTRRVSQTRGLIRYLRRHHHTTPSEMVEIKLHCAMPMFVARQWIRHRTACLAEGTEIHFDLPGGVKRKGNQLYKLRIEEVWDRFQPTRNKQKNPFFKRDRVRGMLLRQMDESTGEITHTRVVDVFRNGLRPVFRMVLEDGKAIEATADHRFLFADGWSTLARVAELRESGGRAVWKPGDYYVHVNGESEWIPAQYRDPIWLQREYRGHRRSIADLADCHHIVPVWADPSRARDESNLTMLCGDRHRSIQGRELEFVETLGGPPVEAEWVPTRRIPWNRLERTRLVRIERIEYVGERETYDLEVEGPYHNFVANGVVTHNSVNELSARYSLMPLLFYTPGAEHFAHQSATNRQGRAGAAPAEVYREAVERWERIRAEAGGAYRWLLEEDVAREIARIDLPVSLYTQWYWKIDLHNLLHFLSLRVDPRAQWEIRAYAEVIAGIVKRVAPLSYEAWVDYDLESRPLTRAERVVLAGLLGADEAGVRARDGAAADPEALAAAGLSKREVAELIEKLQPPGRPDFELDLSAMRGAEEMAEEMYEAVPGSFE